MPTIILKNTDDLREFLKRGNLLQYLDVPSFEFDVIAFEKVTQEVLRQRPHYTQDRAEARAAYRLLSMNTVSNKAPVIAQGKTRWVRTLKTAWNISRDGSKPPIFTTSRVWHWVKIIWAILLLVGVFTIAFEGRAHAQGNANGTGNAGNALQGINLQFQNAGTPLATRVSGRVNVNCGTNMSCSFSGNTFTLTSTGGAGSGCTPPGGSGSLLYDNAAGGCLDITKFTTNGTTTITGLATSIFDLSASATFKAPASAGFAPTTANFWGYDSTNNRGVLGNGTDTSFLTWIHGTAPTTNDCVKFSGTLGGLISNGGPCPATLAAASHQFFTSYTSTTGIFTKAQPVAADIGSIPGSTGQLLFNNAGVIDAEDPVVSPRQDAATTQTITATGALTGVTITNVGKVLVTISGTYAGVAFNFEGSPDGTFTPAFPVTASRVDSVATETVSGTLTANTTRSWFVNVSGHTKFRLNVTGYTSGTANVTITPIYFQSPDGANVNIANSPAITFASPQAVTQSGNWTNRIVGNAGGILDAAGQNVAFPVNWLGSGCEFTTTPTTITTTNGSPLACDNANNLLINLKTALPAGSNVIGHVIVDSGAINATLAAETTKVIGTVNQGTSPWVDSCTAANCTVELADSGGNKFTSNGATQSRSLDANLVSVLGATMSKTNPAFFALTDGTNQLTAALSAWGTAPTGTFVQGVNANQFISGTIQGNDGTAGIAGVGGHFADNGVAAATNRIPTLPCIYQTSYLNGTAATQGRNGALSCGTDGLIWAAILPSVRPASYHWSGSFAGSSTTFAAHIAGNATNTLLVTRVLFSCTATTAGNVTVTVNKTSAASSGGTAATLTAVPDDSNYAAASSVAQSFTGTGPTVGTLVGQIDAYKLGCMATGTATPNDVYILNLRQKPVVLRGVAQTLEIGVGAATTGGNYTVTFEGIETATILP